MRGVRFPFRRSVLRLMLITGFSFLVGCDPTLVLYPVAEPLYGKGDEWLKKMGAAYYSEFESRFSECDPPVEGVRCSEFLKDPDALEGVEKLVLCPSSLDRPYRIQELLSKQGIKISFSGETNILLSTFYEFDGRRHLLLYGTNHGLRIQIKENWNKSGCQTYIGGNIKPLWDFEARFDSIDSIESKSVTEHERRKLVIDRDLEREELALTIIAGRLAELIKE